MNDKAEGDEERSSRQITLTALPDIPLIQRGDDLAAIILRGLSDAQIKLEDGDVLVLAQKIVSKAEGRMVRLRDVAPTPRAEELARESGKDARFCEVVLWDAREIVRVRDGLIIVETKQGSIIRTLRRGMGKNMFCACPRMPIVPHVNCANACERKQRVRWELL